MRLPATPGRVGVCLSGGGSRALAAGMGQLRALKQLTVNGMPVLGQVRALSTVSGGSWLGVPFIFLPSTAASDDAYLGPYVADQSTLTPAQLAVLPAGNTGTPITSPLDNRSKGFPALYPCRHQCRHKPSRKRASVKRFTHGANNFD
jgi:hypothetical protein